MDDEGVVLVHLRVETNEAELNANAQTSDGDAGHRIY